ncbi:hypothetical protein HMP0721_1910 [Pseudoramibacter alactolyticus ATCC 23263]|uniref:Uncharacterized protein n=1 Tax=Pseudoramibacter alactolyticus ATCC 23263 TaxID=887929 RepID=E6MIS5_9FIRM|nr:hypothetical protein HMP0721_1910 [Pseudoramibacter alactolyticus ATCC 23263]
MKNNLNGAIKGVAIIKPHMRIWGFSGLWGLRPSAVQENKKVGRRAVRKK